MSVTVLIDSFAWFEYFFGTARGKKVREILQSDERIIISSINLFEVYSRYLGFAEGEADEKKNFMLARSAEVVDASKDIAVAASKLKKAHGLAMADALILATAFAKNAKLLTGDKHFARFDNVILI